MKHYARVLFTLILSAAAAHASVSVDPIRVELDGKPGQRIEGSYIVTNPENSPVLVSISSKKYFTLDENKKIAIEDWFEMPEREFRLEKHASKEIMYTITVPGKASGFLMLLNSFSAKKLDENGNVLHEMINKVFSMPVYVRVKGTQDVRADIKEIRIGGAPQELRVMVSVSNTGNTYLRTTGEAEILRDGKTVGSITLKEGWPVFPGKTESYRGQHTGLDLEPGTYTMIIRVHSDALGIHLEKKSRFSVTKKGDVKEQ